MAITRIGNIADTIPNSSVQNVKMSNIVQSKNIIINGDMSIAQRSTSVASITTSGYHTTDRWQTSMGTAGTWTQTQSTDVPTGQGFATSFKMDCTTANGSLSAGSSLAIQQGIEGQNLQYLKKGTLSAESLTASFWVKSNKTGTYVAELYDGDNSRQISKSYTISSADTWEKKTLTYAGDTTGALGNDNGNSLSLNFWLVAGTNFSSGSLATSWQSYAATDRAVGQVNLADSTANDFFITGVQLEAGTTASEFEFLPVDVNLQRCQRYFHQIQGNASATTALGIGFSNNSTQMFSSIFFPATMRSIPSITGSSGISATDANSYDVSASSVAVHLPSINSMNLQVTVSSGLATLRVGYNQLSASTSSYLALSSEL